MSNITMKYIKTAAFSIALAFFALIPSATAEAAYTNAQLQVQIQLLMQQALLLQAQLPATNYTTYNSYDCYDYVYGSSYCGDTYNSSISRIEVDFVGRVAQVRVVYRSRDDRRYSLYANTTREVANGLTRELGLSALQIERLIDVVNGFDDDYADDIRSIDVSFDDDDASVVVRFRNSTTDRFTLRNVDGDEDEVIEKIADRYNVSERAIEDITDFANSYSRDFDFIDADFFDDDVDITIRFRNGTIDRYTIRNVDYDRNEVIEYLADRYDVSERVIKSAINFH